MGCLLSAALGCSIPTSQVPTDISRSEVPFGLLSSQPAPGKSPTPPLVPVLIYVAKGTQIVPIKVSAPPPGRIDQAIRVLLNGVDTAQSQAGLRSAIPEGTHLVSFDLTGETANLDMSTAFTTAPSADQALAVAELVFTATASRRIIRITVSVEGRHLELPLPDGSLTDLPVTRADYAGLQPRRS